MGWQPLIEGSAKVQLLEVVRDIATALQTAPPNRVMREAGDRALMRAYLAQDGAVDDPEDVVSSSLGQAVTLFAQGGVGGGLFDGAAGIGWLVEHLAGGETADRVCTAVDAALLRSLDGWTGDYDLISGLVGFGVYALERGEAGKALAVRVLDELERTARKHGGGTAWHTAPELLPPWQLEKAQDGYWNLGLAHGNPGVVAMLARYVRHGVEPVRATALLDDAVAFMLAAEPPRDSGRYPAWHPSDGKATRRLAWCYGDLGVSVALVSAAIARDREDWRAQAVELARNCARTAFADAEVFDCGLCHGSAGAAHLFGRLHHATGEALFADAARRWLDQVLAMRSERPIAGFPSRSPADAQEWSPDASLLTGAAGVALAIHGLISEIEPSWDRLLLADLA